VAQSFRIKRHQKGSKHSQCQRCSLIFRVKVRVKVYHICLGLNSQRIGRSILVQSSKVNQTQRSLQERKQVVKAIETIQSRIIYCKSTP
jgi:hypothetical protein